MLRLVVFYISAMLGRSFEQRKVKRHKTDLALPRVRRTTYQSCGDDSSNSVFGGEGLRV